MNMSHVSSEGRGGGYSKKSYYAKQNSTNNAALAMTDQLYRNSCYGSNVNP